MAVLGASYDNYQVINLGQNILDSFKVSEVEGLESAHVEAGGQRENLARIPEGGRWDYFSLELDSLSLKERLLNRGVFVAGPADHRIVADGHTVGDYTVAWDEQWPRIRTNSIAHCSWTGFDGFGD